MNKQENCGSAESEMQPSTQRSTAADEDNGDTNADTECHESAEPARARDGVLAEYEVARGTEEPTPFEPPASETVRLALLPPDHPLLQQFQAKLKEYLLRSKEQLANEIAEIKYQQKLKEAAREEQGAKLYDLQQGINRQNEQLDEYVQEIQTNMQKRMEMEDVVAKLKQEYEEILKDNKEQKEIYNKRMAELENMNTLEGHIRHWADEVEDEVKNAKRTVNRDTQLQKQLSEEKKKSDMLFYQLDLEVKQEEREIEILHNEITEVEAVNNVLKMSINDANTDLEVLQSEHKRLTQAWSDVIVAIQHRDKILLETEQAMGKEQEVIKLNTMSIEAIKKQMAKERKSNVKLEAFKGRLMNDCGNLKREYQKQSHNFQALQDKLEEFPLIIEQNEKDLSEANREGNNLEVELRRLQWQSEKLDEQKYQNEDSMLKLTQEQLITDKASQYRLKLLRNAQETRRSNQLNLAQVQAQLSETLVEIERSKGILIKMNFEKDDLEKKLKGMEKAAELIATEMRNMETQIDIKLKKVERLSSRLSQLTQNGYVEENGYHSDLKRKIRLLENTIQATEQQIRELQKFWLMMQNHYVNLSEKRNNQLTEIQVTQKQFGIVKQKSLKIDVDLEKQEEISKELNRDIETFLTKLQLLNTKISKSRQNHDAEESECQLEHAELIIKLKEHEMNVLQTEAAIDELQDEIEQYKDLVLDKHRESLSWETKYKLIEETLRWHKDEKQQDSEIGIMKCEIHRMKIRHQQLVRAQEKLAQDLQHGVAHREHIYVAASNKKLAEIKAQRLKTGVSSKQKTIELRNRLKKIQNEISVIGDQQLTQVTHENERIRADLARLQADIEHERTEGEHLMQQIDESLLSKHYNLERIVRKQNRAKAYRRLSLRVTSTSTSTSAVTAAATPKIRSEAAVGELLQKQMEINDNLLDVVQVLCSKFPERKKFFAKITQVLRD